MDLALGVCLLGSRAGDLIDERDVMTSDKTSITRAARMGNWCGRDAGPGLDGRHGPVHRGPGVLPVKLPLADAVDVVRRLVSQSLDLGRHRRHAGAAVGVYLPAVHEYHLGRDTVRDAHEVLPVPELDDADTPLLIRDHHHCVFSDGIPGT